MASESKAESKLLPLDFRKPGRKGRSYLPNKLELRGGVNGPQPRGFLLSRTRRFKIVVIQNTRSRPESYGTLSTNEV